MKTIVTLLLCCTACAGQNNINHTNTDSMKTRLLCTLEETGDGITYLTDLMCIAQNTDGEQSPYAGGDELFLRYEILTIPKGDGNPSIRERAVLHCIPERIAKIGKRGRDIQIIDTYIFKALTEVLIFYENGKPDGHAEPSGKWNYAGDYTDDGIHAKILHYFFNHREEIPVSREDLRKLTQ